MDGAKSTGADVKYYDLYDLKFGGFRSCLICKGKESVKPKCFWKDDLSPIINEIYTSYGLIVASPVYFGRTSSGFFAFLERLHFPTLSYDD